MKMILSHWGIGYFRYKGEDPLDIYFQQIKDDQSNIEIHASKQSLG